ncbi:MAG: hypothetical protein KGD64_03620 [Candidatus Heimdallarchaeota archaeon]|nr:hypothetical protein [Candidatus Heimdallarchaeota archaeon]
MKNEKIAFRKASEDEVNIIVKHIEKYFGEKAVGSLQNRCLWIKDGNIREVYALHTSIERVVESIPHGAYSAGILVGSLIKDNFQLEIEGSLLIRSVTKKVLHIKTDQFLYGKSIFAENIVDFDSAFQKGDLLIIAGRNNIHYGIGEVNLSSDELSKAPSNTVAISGNKNIPRDRGWYLRKGN